ncbi:MAG TPA: hypothetical protein DCF82_03650, partial [Marinobacter hydrocarbonoclasticus]|nr:hypothetical protein [Marinobacter nauticus]
MIERDDLDMLAAEFVLGTLPIEDRQRVQRLRTTHPELDAQILQWESRLSALNDEIEPVDPAPGLFARIERSIDQLEQASSQHNEVVRLRQQVSRWRLSTAATSIAAMLLIAVMMLEPTPTKSPYVAVFQHNDEQPAFLLTVDLARK